MMMMLTLEGDGLPSSLSAVRLGAVLSPHIPSPPSRMTQISPVCVSAGQLLSVENSLHLQQRQRQRQQQLGLMMETQTRMELQS
ncbi:uncharacterized protein V6R79_025643 [Siganus canaliculatus]